WEPPTRLLHELGPSIPLGDLQGLAGLTRVSCSLLGPVRPFLGALGNPGLLQARGGLLAVTGRLITIRLLHSGVGRDPLDHFPPKPIRRATRFGVEPERDRDDREGNEERLKSPAETHTRPTHRKNPWMV